VQVCAYPVRHHRLAVQKAWTPRRKPPPTQQACQQKCFHLAAGREGPPPCRSPCCCPTHQSPPASPCWMAWTPTPPGCPFALSNPHPCSSGSPSRFPIPTALALPCWVAWRHPTPPDGLISLAQRPIHRIPPWLPGAVQFWSAGRCCEGAPCSSPEVLQNRQGLRHRCGERGVCPGSHPCPARGLCRD